MFLLKKGKKGEEEKKCHHYDYFQREQNGRTLREFRRHFAPAGVFQRVPSENCARQLGTSVVPSTFPSFQHTKHRNVSFIFLFKFSSVTETTRRQFFEKVAADGVRNRMRSLLLLRWVPRHLFVNWCLCWRSLHEMMAATYPELGRLQI